MTNPARRHPSPALVCILLAAVLFSAVFLPVSVCAAVPQKAAAGGTGVYTAAAPAARTPGPVSADRGAALREPDAAAGLLPNLLSGDRLERSGSRLRFRLSDGSYLTSAWRTIGSKTYYFNKKGYALTGLQKIGSRYYIFSSKGVLRKGWIYYKKHWYYGSVNRKGRLLLGWQKIGGKKYYISVKTHYRLTGFQYIGRKMYYFNAKGVQQTTDQVVRGRRVVFNPDGSIYSLGSKIFGTYGSTKGQQVASYALQFVGNPYRWGGSSLTHGADCSGFVMAVYAHFGISLPHYDAWIRQCGRSVSSLAAAVPGDVICYNGHVAIYIGGGRIVHAADYRSGICIGSNAAFMRILSIRRFF